MLDLTDVVAQGGPVPSGTYPVVIEKAQVTPTKTGGEMIKIQLKITGDVQAGRNIFDQFNIKNANPQAVQIGLGQLKGMMKAFGHPNPNKLASCDELIGLKGIVTVKVESSEGYQDQAKVKAYKPLTGTATDTAAPIAPAAAVAGANPF